MNVCMLMYFMSGITGDCIVCVYIGLVLLILRHRINLRMWIGGGVGGDGVGWVVRGSWRAHK